MSIRRLLCLAIASASVASAAPEFTHEDLGSVQQAFRRKDPSLAWFQVGDKQSIDAVTSIMVVRAATIEGSRLAPVEGMDQVGIFAVASPSNRVQLVIDIFPETDSGLPSIGDATLSSVTLHFYSSYGFYDSSLKYFYNLNGRTPPLKFHYRMLDLTSSETRNGALIYSSCSAASLSPSACTQIEIRPRPGDSPPAYRVTSITPAEPDSFRSPAPFVFPDGSLAEIPRNQFNQPLDPAGFSMWHESEPRQFYPVPATTMEMHRRLRPDEEVGEIDNRIGPVTQQGYILWFASQFYDGEGTSGVGAIGSFDAKTHKFEMRYLPEIAPWSGSAIRLDNDDLWIGLATLPEGAAIGGGLLRYNVKTGTVKTYSIPDVVSTIDRLGDAIYCGTSNGIYRVRAGVVTHMRFEPDTAGTTTMVTSRK